MKKLISSSTVNFKGLVRKAKAAEMAFDAFTDLLESLRAKNSEGQAEDALSISSTSEIFKKWGSTKSASPEGDSFETITAAFEICMAELTLTTNFMMKSETGIKGSNFDPIKKALRELGGYDDKKKSIVQTISANKLGKKLTPDFFETLNKDAANYLRFALGKGKNKTKENTGIPETFQSISGLLESDSDHGEKKIKICQLIQALYTKYTAQAALLFAVSDELNKGVNLYFAKDKFSESARKSTTPPSKEVVLQSLLLLNPTTGILPQTFSEKSTIDINYFLEKVTVKEIVAHYDESVIERIIASLETWTTTPENQERPEFAKLNTHLKNLYNALISDHKAACSTGTSTSETKLAKVLMKLASANPAKYVLSAKSYDDQYLLTAKEAQDLLFGILDKEIIAQKKESTPFRSNTTAMRLLRQYILRISGDFFPNIVAKLVDQLKVIRADRQDPPLKDAAEVALLTEDQTLGKFLTSENLPPELAQFLKDLKVKITENFQENFRVVLENFIVLRIIGADIINSVPTEDPHHKALQVLTLTMQKAIKEGQKSEQRLNALDAFLNALYGSDESRA
jgi:hypothetical protein